MESLEWAPATKKSRDIAEKLFEDIAELLDSEKKELWRAFLDLDTTFDGKIEPEEFLQLVRRFVKVGAGEGPEAYLRPGLEGLGAIGFPQLLGWWAQRKAVADPTTQALEAALRNHSSALKWRKFFQRSDEVDQRLAMLPEAMVQGSIHNYFQLFYYPEADGDAPPARFPPRYQPKDSNQQSRPSGEDGEEGRRRYVPRQLQSTRYGGGHGPPPAEGDTQAGQQPNHQQPHARRPPYAPPEKPGAAPKDPTAAPTPTFSRPPPRTPVIHPLGRAYTFSAYRRPPAQFQDSESYEKSIKVIGRFDTVEGFWGFYSHVERPGDLTGVSADLHVFAEGIAPVWEHDVNRRGGKFTIRPKKATMNQLWEDLLMALIGGRFDFPADICGAVASVRERKRDALSVWIRDSSRVDVRERLGHQLRAVLGLADSTDVEYKPHSTSLHDLPTTRADDGD